MSELTLQHRRIAIPEHRELDVFAALLERRGATVLRCPLVAIKDAPDPEPVLEWIRRFNDGTCDDLIVLTGEGIRRLIGCIECREPPLLEPFLERLGKVRTIVRGPKPGRALRPYGIKPTLVADVPTSAGVIDTLRTLDLRGHTVGLQLYGTEPNLPVQEALRAAGAAVMTVAPYVYADAVETRRVETLIDELAAGTLDAIAFTSMAQVDRLFRVARDLSRTESLRAGLARTLVAAVGPVVADALHARQVPVQAMPAGDYFLKPLMRVISTALGDREADGADIDFDR